jgi:sodium transport system permease protein
MGNDGSARDGFSGWAARLLLLAGVTAVVVAGVAAMTVTAGLTARLGVRPMLMASELALAAPALLALAIPRLRAALALRPVSPAVIALALASGAALWVASLGLLELQYTLWTPPPGYLQEFQRLHDMLRPRGPADAVLSVLAIAVAPGVCEELLFRGLVLHALRGRLGTAAAVVVSALLFGAIHLDFSGSGPTLYRVPFAVAVGVGFALLRLRTGSLVPAMLAHALVNATTFAAALQEAPTAVLPAPRPWLGLGLLVGGATAQAWLLSRLRSPSAVPSHAAADPL